MSDDDIELRIGLPLPLDVVSTLSTVIGTVYPSARIKTNTGHGDMVILIAKSERARRVNKREAAKAKVDASEGGEAELVAWNEDGPSFSTPEEASLLLGKICASMLEIDEATNYLEAECRTEDGKRYVVAACRSKGQTPHALRMKAEAERDALQARLDALGAA